MLTLSTIGDQIAARRKTLGLSQAALSKQASVSRATLDALENGRISELGFSKITKILSALGMELKIQDAISRRPTLEELMEEDRNDQGLDRRR
ncbi:MAG TPA: helix-turn-helix domain-containing protein [Terracidiphilus sp.]|jgi:transcriptional regulator with XRE-family HTH domain|nr:helix-turn-helix domain-containing protein [Terracidiphilus sp.]